MRADESRPAAADLRPAAAGVRLSAAADVRRPAAGVRPSAAGVRKRTRRNRSAIVEREATRRIPSPSVAVAESAFCA